MLDFKSDLYAAVWSRILTGVANYNANLPSGAKALPPNNLFDERVDARLKDESHRDATSYPQVQLYHGDGNQQRPLMPTFALASGTADTVMPIQHSLTMQITFDKWTSDVQTPLEAFLHAALMSGYPKLGVSYVRDFTIGESRKFDWIGPPKRVMVKRTLTFTLRPHLSQLQ